MRRDGEIAERMGAEHAAEFGSRIVEVDAAITEGTVG